MTHIPFPDWLTSAQTIAIVGYGREGKSTNQFLEKYFPDKKRVIYETHQEKFDIPQVDVVFKSPGIPRKNIHIHSDSYLTSQADLFVQLFGAQTIAVTGTKGKSTTAHAIAHVLNSVGKSAILMGNIGKPALDFVDQMEEETFAVFEMSAFQTETLHTAPHIAVFTSLYQDHLDYYDTMEEYVDAKKHLFDLQTKEDVCIFRDDFKRIVDVVSTSKAQLIPYNLKTSTVEINHVPALIIAKLLGAGEKSVVAALASVPKLPGRLETVGRHEGITFIDDALATIPEATMLALDTVANVATLIVGGHDRRQDYTKLAEKIVDSGVSTLILFPTTGAQIGELVSKLEFHIRLIPAQSMEEAVSAAYAYTPKEKSVLLSTAAPSFGVFTNYADRSRQYREWIEKLASAP